MKKFITTILLLALALPMVAQPTEVEQKWTVKGGAAYLTPIPLITTLFGVIWIGVGLQDNEKLDIGMPPYFSLEAQYAFNSRWSAGVSLGYEGLSWTVVNKDTGERSKSEIMPLIPVMLQGRCNYLNRPAVKLYGSVEAGALLMPGDKFQVVFDAQVNPIGVEFGRRLFGSIEAGFGLNYMGGRIGLGYRF